MNALISPKLSNNNQVPRLLFQKDQIFVRFSPLCSIASDVIPVCLIISGYYENKYSKYKLKHGDMITGCGHRKLTRPINKLRILHIWEDSQELLRLTGHPSFKPRELVAGEFWSHTRDTGAFSTTLIFSGVLWFPMMLGGAKQKHQILNSLFLENDFLSTLAKYTVTTMRWWWWWLWQSWKWKCEGVEGESEIN